MKSEIQSIRKNVTDKIIVITLIFLSPAYFFAMARSFEVGWLNINYIHTALYVFMIALAIFRNRLHTDTKIYLLVAIYTILGLSALWFIGFSGIHYFVIVAIAIASVLAQRKIAFVLIAFIAIMYVAIAIFYMLHIHEPSVKPDTFTHSILQWTTIILSLIAFSAIFIEGFGELFHKLIGSIEEKQRISEKLKEQNEKLQTTKNELAQKVEEIHDINIQLKLSEEKYRNLVNFSPNVIYWYSTLDGGLFYSDRIQEILGYKPKEIERVPNFWESSIHPDDRIGFKRIFGNFDPEKKYNLKYRVKAKNGNWVWLRDTLLTLKQTNDEIIFQGHLTDITAEKEMEEKLRESEMRWHFSVDGSNLGLWDWDIKTNQVFYSKRWKEMLGYDEYEVSDTLEDWRKRVHPDDLEIAKQVLQGYLDGETESYSSEHRMLCKDGTYKWILDRGKIVSYSDDGKPLRMIGTHSDIHDKKLAELDLKRLNNTKDRFFSIIAHDLKNPFNSMIGLSEILNENFDELDVNTQRKFILAIHQGILKTYDLLEDLLLWSRAQRNTLDFFPKREDLLIIASEVLEPLKMSAENKSIEINIDIPAGAVIFADKFMFSFILRNLISNAIKFTPREGSILITSKAVIYKGRKSMQIEVRDSGIGMDALYCEQLFDPGQNVSRPGTEDEKGTGMGLSICYEFVKKHGGDIWVESKPEKGSHFFFTLPLNR